MKSKRNIIYWLFVGFVLSTLFLPVFFLNKVFFALIIGVYLLRCSKTEFSIIAPIVILVIFGVGFMHGMINGGEMSLAVQFLTSVAMMFLIYPIVSEKIRISELIMRITPIYECVSLLFIVYGINNVSFSLPDIVLRIVGLFDNKFIDSIGDVMMEYGATAIGYRSFFGGAGVMIHLGSVPFLLIPVGLYARALFENRDKKVRKVIVIVVALLISIISTSRALVLSELIVFGLAFVKSRKMSGKIVAGCVATILFVAGFVYLLKNSTVFSTSDLSNSIKLGHIQGYVDNLNLKNMLLGDGLASVYYSPVYGGYLAHTEITLLDYIRYFGVFLGINVYVLLVFPFGSINIMFLKESFDFIIFAMYLVLSLTNPVLFNSIGMIVILYYWDEYYLFRQEIGE